MNLENSIKVFNILGSYIYIPDKEMKTLIYYFTERDNLVNELQINEDEALDRIFLMVDNRLAERGFKKIYNLISSENKRYKLFISVQTMGGYKNQYNKNILSDIRKMFHSKYDEPLLNYVDNEGYIKIFRGVTNYSNNIEKTLSWTINKDKALWFAKRLPAEWRYLYEGKIKLKNIICFINDREEEEVIAKYADIENIENTIIRNFIWGSKELTKEETTTTITNKEEALENMNRRNEEPN